VGERRGKRKEERERREERGKERGKERRKKRRGKKRQDAFHAFTVPAGVCAVEVTEIYVSVVMCGVRV
jgi:hypothetical protein